MIQSRAWFIVVCLLLVTQLFDYCKADDACPSGYNISTVNQIEIIDFKTLYIPDRNEIRSITITATSGVTISPGEIIQFLYCYVTPAIQIGRLGYMTNVVQDSASTIIVVSGENAATYNGPPANELIGTLAQLLSPNYTTVLEPEPVGVKPPSDTPLYVTSDLMFIMIGPILLFNLSYLLFKLRTGKNALMTPSEQMEMTQSQSIYQNNLISPLSRRQEQSGAGFTLANIQGPELNRAKQNSVAKVHAIKGNPVAGLSIGGTTFAGSSDGDAVQSPVREQARLRPESILVHEQHQRVQTITQNQPNAKSEQTEAQYKHSNHLFISVLLATLFISFLPTILKFSGVNFSSHQSSTESCAAFHYSSSQLTKCTIESVKATFWYLTHAQVNWIVAWLSVIVSLMCYVHFMLHREYTSLLWIPVWMAVGISNIFFMNLCLWESFTERDMASLVVVCHWMANMLQCVVAVGMCILKRTSIYRQWESQSRTYYWRPSRPILITSFVVVLVTAICLWLTAIILEKSVQSPSFTRLYIIPAILYLFLFLDAIYTEEKPRRAFYWLSFIYQQVIPFLANTTTSDGLISAQFFSKCTAAVLLNLLWFLNDMTVSSSVRFQDTKILQELVNQFSENMVMREDTLTHMNEALKKALPVSLQGAVTLKNSMLRVASMDEKKNEEKMPKRKWILLLTSWQTWMIVTSIFVTSRQVPFWSNLPSNFCNLHENDSLNSCMTLLVSGVRGTFDHALLETTSTILCLSVVLLSWMHYSIYRQDLVLFYFFAFCGSGLGDIIHNLVASRYIQGNDVANFITFSWSIARLYNASVLVLGSVNVLLLKGLAKYTKYFKEKEGRTYVSSGYMLLWGLLLLCPLLYVLVYCWQADELPLATSAGFIVRPFDFPVFLLYCFFFLLSLVSWYWQTDRDHLRGMRTGLLLAAIPNMMSEAHMSFGSMVSYDTDFNAAHVLKLMANGLVSLGLLMDVLEAVFQKQKLQDQLLRALSHN